MFEAPKPPSYGRSPHKGATKCNALRNAKTLQDRYGCLKRRRRRATGGAYTRTLELKGAPKCKALQNAKTLQDLY